MKSRNSKLFIPVVTILVVMGAFAVYQLTSSQGLAPDAAQAAMNGASDTLSQTDPKPAPDFALKDVDGTVHHLSDYRGKVVMLNFWATWCPPCRKEIPEFADLQKKFGDQGIQFIGIAMDDEGLAKVQPWLKAHPVSYPILINDQVVTKPYGEMSSIPVTLVIDRKGMIRSSFVGYRVDTLVEAMFKPLLAESTPSPSGTK
jgi:peroxiredoxin